MKILGLLCFLLKSICVDAQPQIFGLEIGSPMDAKQIQARFGGMVSVNTMQLAFDDRVFQGAAYRVSIKRIEFEGLREVYVFLSRGCVLAVLASVDKHRYKQLRDLLNTKYTLIKEHSPFIGNKYAKFYKDDTFIELDARQMASFLTLTYMHKQNISAMAP
jgi:hypothetical protein